MGENLFSMVFPNVNIDYGSGNVITPGNPGGSPIGDTGSGGGGTGM